MKSIKDLLDGPEPGKPETELMSDVEALEVLDAKTFSLAVLNSKRFQDYINHALTMGSLPAAIATRFMDYGWGKPPDRMEHTGKNGGAIESISEVRRVIIHVGDRDRERTTPDVDQPTAVTH